MAGLLEWSNSLRLAMANDPGRDIFQGQLNTHGFMFLDNYLDNILSRPSQDMIIELVKTPGRKKVVQKKHKALGVSKLRATTLQHEGDEETKENIAPLNSFHTALLKASAEHALHTTDVPLLLQDITEDATSYTPLTALYSSHLSPVSDPNTSLLAPGRSEHNDLSVIAEADEQPEPTGLSQKNSESDNSQKSSSLSQSPIAAENPVDNASMRVESCHMTTIIESSSNIFHSVTLESPLKEVSERLEKPSPAPQLPEASDMMPATASVSPSQLLRPDLIATDGHILDSKPDSDEGRDIEVPLRDHDSVLSGDKFGATLFPTLPAPMPLRKSVRAPHDTSVGTGPIGIATPSAPPGGKRTSWLKKAREVKALEVAIKYTNTPVPVDQPHPSQNVLKRKSSDLITPSAAIVPEEGQRRAKSSKVDAHDEAPLRATPEHQKESDPTPCPPSLLPPSKEAQGQEGMLDRFKRTVEDLGARVGKSMGKSLGAAAASSALAEARAAAEARVAERHNKEEEMTRISGSATMPSEPLVDKPTTGSSVMSEDPSPLPEGRRLSLSDLFPTNRKMKDKSARPATSSKDNLIPSPELRGHSSMLSPDDHTMHHRESTTTTPPDSPHTSHSKPPPMPIAHMSGVEPHPPSPSSIKYTALSRQTTMDSLQLGANFDDIEAPTWMSETQDTEYSSRFNSQSEKVCENLIHEDGSWPIHRKLASVVQWSPGNHAKEDSMYNTLPSQSQRGNTTTSNSHKKPDDVRTQSQELPPFNDLQSSCQPSLEAFDLGMVDCDSELEDIILYKKPTISLVQNQKVPESEGQTSLVSSQSQIGFLGQASKFLGNALGTSKKQGNDVKKVLQMAAIAAKKQQEENDKKAVRLKEMENRRQLATQRKAEEERARTLEQGKKANEERRKREREDNTDKRASKIAVKKDEDLLKKRKIVTAESEKKELKKPLTKPILKSSMKHPPALSSSTAYNASHQTTATSSSSSSDPKTVKTPAPMTNFLQKGKGNAPSILSLNPDDDLPQPSQLVQIQMAARVKAQIQAAHPASEPPITSESIELPEINSEYSDSDDEDRSKSFPEWAQSPELRQALQLQSTINPDDIFGAIRPLRMEELFKTRTNRFRARTSSANWTGTDGLTVDEEMAYAKKMGYK